jgi:hypothetical protein
MTARLQAGFRLLLTLLAGSVLAGPLAAAISGAFIDAHQARLEKVFSHLDPEHPDMGPMRRDWESGNHLEAAAALAGYFGAKTFPMEVLEPNAFHAELMERMESALDDRFFLLEDWETVPRLENGGLDWRHRGERKDKEWAWMLNRHGMFPDLAEAYRRSGDTRYRETLNALWRDWILNNPYPDRLTFSEQWRALEVARRMLNSWVHVFYDPNNLLDPETRLLVLSSVLEHGDALREHASFWGGNHLISEKLALLTLTFAWPEFEDSADWQAYAIERVSRQLMAQTYPDGSYKELSNHYQRVVLFNAQYFIRLMARIDPDYKERPVMSRIETMWDFFARVTQPDGSGPISNASDREDNAVFIREVHEFYDRPDWLHIGTNGRDGVPPEGPASRLFPWAGQAILRNGWDDEADWVYFDAGPYGTAHQHVDRLHVSASLRGRPTLVDNGRYTYQPGPWRDYFKGPLGHNVLLLDGQPARQGPRAVEVPLPVMFEELPDATVVAASSVFELPGPLGLPGFGKQVPWTRAVLLDRSGFLLIIDHLVTFTDHDLSARWHFHPDVSEAEAISSLKLVNPPDGSIRLETYHGQGPPEVAGFYSPDYNEKFPAPELRVNLPVGQPTTLVWLLQAPGSPSLQVECLSEPGAPVLQLEISGSAGPVASITLRLHPDPELIAYEHAGSSY